MSIKLRLTLLYSAIVGLTLIIFSFALYFTVARVTLTELKATLKNETQRAITSGNVFVDPKYGLPIYAQIVNMNGRVLDRTANLGDNELPLPDDDLWRIRENDDLFEQATIEGEHLLVYSVWVPGNFRSQPIILQIARSVEGRNQSLSVLQRILIIGSASATILTFGVGWLLAGAALRPINRITQTAQEIGAERDFGRRVNYTGPHDEVGQLATTFNAMLSALQASYRQEAQALQAQRRFVADASHELRTPLTTIRGNIGLLQRDPPISSEDREAVLMDMTEESERMSRLVNDLLVLARADAGRALRNDVIEIRPLLDDICRKARLLGSQHRIICERVDDVAVTGDSDALKQVLLILLDNAIKFTLPGGSITFAAIADDHNVNISVRDTGTGIAPDVLPHIFDRFYRGDTSRTGGGSGLGLAIAQALTQAQHGQISVQSQPGSGSTFTLTLPRTPLPDQPAERIPDQTAIAA